MALEILHYPDKRLRTISQEVVCFDTDLHTLLDAMLESMLESKGIGLAAIQVGVPKRILIINLPREDEQQYPQDRLEIINPVITHKEGTILWKEGCLSVPDFYEEIERSAQITLSYQDRTGTPKMLQAKELLSVAIQHEMDHLNGILFVDKLSMLKRKKFEKEFKKTLKIPWMPVSTPFIAPRCLVPGHILWRWRRLLRAPYPPLWSLACLVVRSKSLNSVSNLLCKITAFLFRP